MTVNEGLSAGFSFQHCRISLYLGKWVVRVSYHFIKRTGRDKQEGYISSEHVCGFSILYPDLRTPKSSRLLMVGYGVPPRDKEEKWKIRCKTLSLIWEAKTTHLQTWQSKNGDATHRVLEFPKVEYHTPTCWYEWHHGIIRYMVIGKQLQADAKVATIH